MKNYLILILVLALGFGIPKSLHAQKSAVPDTIFVTTEHKTRVFLPYDIVYLDQGNKLDYGAIIKDATAWLKANSSDADPNLLIIGMGNKMIYQGTIAYKKDMSMDDLVVDLRNVSDNELKGIEVSHRSVTEDTEDLDKQVVHVRLGILLGDNSKSKSSLGISNSKIDGIIQKIKIDSDFIYIKLQIINGSKTVYEIENFDFVYKNPSKTLKGEFDPKRERPIVEQTKTSFERKEGGILGFVLRKYNLGNKGYLEITIKEKNGGRDLVIKIPSDIINKSATF